jgi:GH15 family glucan-1,4-alpha-glucosidase
MNEAVGRANVAPGRPQPAIAASVGRVLAAQDASGSFVASPDFAQYQFCWLRDGSFTAYALDRAGEAGAAQRFHEWAARALLGISERMAAAVARAEAGLAPDASLVPPARFSLDGHVVADDWPNFQVDGYGTWLWALHQHLLTSQAPRLSALLLEAAREAARYLDALGTSPCYDVWEEDGGSVHTSTLACVYGGLCAAAELLGEASFAERAAEVRALALAQGSPDGAYPKSDHSPELDGALVWLSQPFGVVPPGDPAFAETVRRISAELDLGGGVRRYPTDTYYGGGAWPVLTASLGWHHASTGDVGEAARCLEWVEARFDEQGRLGEQFGGDERDPASYRMWVERWGPPAADLVWSHAMYIILATGLENAAASSTATVETV